MEALMDTILLPVAGVLGIATALIHGYLGETRIIALASFPSRQAKEFARAVWQLSTATWVAGSLTIAAAPFVFAELPQRRLALLVACSPMVYGLVCNAWISRGRHFGWMALAAVIGLAIVGGGLSG
jgi:hypothetical protein